MTEETTNPRSFRSKYRGSLIHVRGIAPGVGIVGAFAMTNIEQSVAISDAMHEAYAKQDFNAFGMPNVQHIAPLLFVASTTPDNGAPSSIERLRFLNPAGEAILDYSREVLAEMQTLTDEQANAQIMPVFAEAFPDFDDATECLNSTGRNAIEALATTVSMQDSIFALGALKLDDNGNFVLNELGYPDVDNELVQAGIVALKGRAYEAEQIADANEREIP